MSLKLRVPPRQYQPGRYVIAFYSLLVHEPYHAVVIAAAAVDDAELAALAVVVGEEVVADQLHLEERVVEGHRAGGVELLPHDQRPVADHLHRQHPGDGLLRLGLVAEAVEVTFGEAAFVGRERRQRHHRLRAPAVRLGAALDRRPGARLTARPAARRRAGQPGRVVRSRYRRD